jgi:hypothetical protein
LVILEILPRVLEVERAAVRLRILREAPSAKPTPVKPDGVVSAVALKTDRIWSNGEKARLGNLWNKIMQNTGAQGILNAEAGT